jgi:hypothetical protein
MLHDDVSFYSISNAGYFPGLLALINSLALTGHTYPIVIGDCGLTELQRQLLRAVEGCRLYQLDPSLVQNPTQYKAFPLLAEARGIAVLIDSDMIVTGSLEPIIAKARTGKLCAYPNPVDDRWFGEWEAIFELPAAPRHQVYVCAGFLAFSVEHHPDLLQQWWRACAAIASHPTVQEGGDWDSPTSQADQDALNALLMSAYPPEALWLEPADGTVCRWDFYALETRDVERLGCRFHGNSPVILHAALTPKPWQRSGATRDTNFTFLRRLLLGRDLVIRPPLGLLDPVLHPGLTAWLLRQRRFLSNMGPLKYGLSFCPAALNRLVRGAGRVMKRDGLTFWTGG